MSWATLLLLLPLLSACTPSFPKGNLVESVQAICQEEYDLEVEAELVGKTFYVTCDVKGLVGQNLQMEQEALEKLEGSMLSSTRVALSSDAEIEFTVVQARDPLLGAMFTLIRYVPDIKSLLYMRISRNDFSERLILETQTGALEDEASVVKNEITLPHFLARLAASRIQKQVTANPLVSIFLQIHKVTGSIDDKTLVLQLGKYEKPEETNDLVDEILTAAVVDTVADLLGKYPLDDSMDQLRVLDAKGESVLTMTRDEVLAEKKKMGKEKEAVFR